MTATRRPRWRCLVELESGGQCTAWGHADADGGADQQLHEHYLAEHYTPPTKDKP